MRRFIDRSYLSQQWTLAEVLRAKANKLRFNRQWNDRHCLNTANA